MGGGIGLTDPDLVASEVLKKRKEVALEWAELISECTQDQLFRLKAEYLEEKGELSTDEMSDYDQLPPM